MDKRVIQVNKLDNEQIEMAIQKISEHINDEVDATCNKVNELLIRYGLKCKMKIVIEELTSDIASEHGKIEQDA